MKKLLFIFILSSFSTFGQLMHHDANYRGLTLGINYFSLKTSNFSTTPEIGLQGGLSLRGNFHNNFDMVFGIQFHQVNFSVLTKNTTTLATDKVVFKLPSAQVFVTPSYRIADENLSVEFGPLIQLNDKFKVDSDYENNIILSNSSLRVIDVTGISNFNVSLLLGVTAGFEHFRFNVQYQYQLNNILSKLNSNDDLPKGLPKFTGRINGFNANIVIYL